MLVELSGQCKPHILADQIEIALIRVTQRASCSLTCSTRISGAEAPAVRPTRRIPSSHFGSISFAASINCASTPERLATSTRRLEFELLGEPTTRINSTSRASCSTASCRFCVA